MRRKAISVAVTQTPLHHVLDFMYGTPERSRFTLSFALALLALSMLLPTSDNLSCSIDLLPK